MKSAALQVLMVLALGFQGGCATSTNPPPPSDLQLTPPPGIPVLEGGLLNQVRRLEEAMPRAKSEGFVPPQDVELDAFSAIATDLEQDRPQAALAAAQANGYELFWYSDKEDEGAVSYLLREADPSRRGWGTYAIRVASTSNIILEAPHPIADKSTPAVAVSAYRALNARALLIAGAHRDANRDRSSDAAHDEHSVFQSIHEVELAQAVSSAGSAIVLQIHGFNSGSHPGYPEVIVGFQHGANINPVDVVQGGLVEARIIEALKKQGVKVGSCGAGQWRDLCGASNIQATTMSRGIFIHLEIDDGIRDNDRRLVAGFVDALGVSP